MAQVWGLDVEQVRGLAREMDREADGIDQTLSRLTGALGNTQWTGPDATQFRDEWQGAHSNALRKVAGALRDTAQMARANADAQERASQ
ncbi:MAG: hypothetical protein KJ659_11250 [Actinobacteria bacterium]|nr:hypothetical protein [Actinomycetota bacterium]MBU1607926.1 hypothetical protein [Actinomycetota bacterium]MBU2316102.1 hypothetical protein [Actinomycetota bacterium]MBU2386050.1 hypothetical protein [Actinomycetota bacterium]